MSLKKLVPTLFPMGKDISFRQYKLLRIYYPFKGKMKDVLVHKIDHFEACGNYTKAITDKDIQHLLDTNIGKTSLLLPGNFFDQSHQSSIVNIEKVQGYVGGIKPFMFTNIGHCINISRHENIRIKDILYRYVDNKGVRRSRLRRLSKALKVIKPLKIVIIKPSK